VGRGAISHLAAIALIVAAVAFGTPAAEPYLPAILGGAIFAQQEPPSTPRAGTPVTFLQINDVYTTVPVDSVGGLARVATLGNREFDFGNDVLIERMHEATFEWVVCNVVDTKTGAPRA
jgi:5'-nucleotidase